jgi:2-dehydropantoate 2-reductase
MSDPIVIWGAGAIGGTLGAAWVRAGHDVIFVDNVPAHVEAMRKHGLAIEGPVEQFTTPPLQAFLPQDLKGTYRRIVLAVKAHHTDAAMKDAGAASRGRRLRAFGAERPQRDRHRAPCRRGAHDGLLRELRCGLARAGQDPARQSRCGRRRRDRRQVIKPRTREMFALLQVFEPDAVLTENIWGFLYGKLGYGALLFGTALTNESIADALASPRHFTLWRKLGEEVMAVAAAKGVRCEGFNGFDPSAFTPTASIADTQRAIDVMVKFNRGSAKSHSGIWRDLAVRKRKTEVDAQIAIIAEIGEGLGVKCPIIRRLVALIHDIEEGRRPMDWATLDALAQEIR